MRTCLREGDMSAPPTLSHATPGPTRRNRRHGPRGSKKMKAGVLGGRDVDFRRLRRPCADLITRGRPKPSAPAPETQTLSSHAHAGPTPRRPVDRALRAGLRAARRRVRPACRDPRCGEPRRGCVATALRWLARSGLPPATPPSSFDSSLERTHKPAAAQVPAHGGGRVDTTDRPADSAG